MKYLAIAALIIILYLNRSYAYFYDFQGDNFIGNPSYPTTHLIQSGEKAENKKLVVLGDSLMAGTGSSQEENGMAYLIAKNLARGQNIEMHNFSRPGMGVDDVLIRQTPEAIKVNPDYIVLMIGTNDVHNKMAASEFDDYYSKILNELNKNTKAKITVINIPFIGSSEILLPPWNHVLSWRINLFNNIILSQAKDYNLEVIDLKKEFMNKFLSASDLYSGDQFHPSDKGYNLWVNFINSQIKK